MLNCQSIEIVWEQEQFISTKNSFFRCPSNLILVSFLLLPWITWTTLINLCCRNKTVTTTATWCFSKMQAIKQCQLTINSSLTSLKNKRNGSRGCLEELPCQVLQPSERTSKKQLLPPSFSSQKFEYEQGEEEKVISLIRADAVGELNFGSGNASEVPTWAGIHHLISTAKLTTKHDGFLPLIPHPITKIETAYTCFKNLMWHKEFCTLLYLWHVTKEFIA